jgi:hypothetical protein
VSIVAVLESIGDEPSISDSGWEALIEDHPALRRPPPRAGINPWTKKPITLPARTDLAIVVDDGRELGSIEWAQDGSRILLARPERASARDALVQVARDVAWRLGVSCNTEHSLVALSEPVLAPAHPEEPLDTAVRLWRAGDKEGATACYMTTQNVGLAEALKALARLVDEQK